MVSQTNEEHVFIHLAPYFYGPTQQKNYPTQQIYNNMRMDKISYGILEIPNIYSHGRALFHRNLVAL